MTSDPSNDPSYWPLFAAAAKTTLVAVISQLGLAVFYAQLAAAKVTVQTYKGFVPFLRIETRDPEAFAAIVQWSALASSAVIFCYAAFAFSRGRRLQVQMGRSFGFADIALIGVVNVVSAHVLSGRLNPTRWMYSLIPIGVMAALTAVWLIHDEYTRRENEPDGLALLVDPA